MPHRTGQATLPLHDGNAPRWLFERMVLLARSVTSAFLLDHSPHDLLDRLSDPYWFQALGCVLGFDWHSSGLTTTACGALKLGLKGREEEFGISVAGGKGATSRKTPNELRLWGHCHGLDPASLVYASKMAAKVDSACVQDGYQLYHHSFFWTKDGEWAVIQQGMSQAATGPTAGFARRYHWRSDRIKDFVDEPQAAICAEKVEKDILNLVDHDNGLVREQSVALIASRPSQLVRELKKVDELILPKRHFVEVSDIDLKRFERVMSQIHEATPKDYETLVGLHGVGAKTLRALALLSELLYGTPITLRDPARFSFAHGGKDGHPFPVDRRLYDQSIATLEKAVEEAKIGRTERLKALQRLSRYR